MRALASSLIFRLFLALMPVCATLLLPFLFARIVKPRNSDSRLRRFTICDSVVMFPRSYPIGAIHVWKMIVLPIRLGAVPPLPLLEIHRSLPLPSQGISADAL